MFLPHSCCLAGARGLESNIFDYIIKNTVILCFLMHPLSIGRSKARFKDVKSVAVLCCAQQTINRHVTQLSREVNFGKTIGFKALFAQKPQPFLKTGPKLHLWPENGSYSVPFLSFITGCDCYLLSVVLLAKCVVYYHRFR